MALVQADVTGIVSGGSAKILFLFLIAQTGLNNAMRMSIVRKFCEFCCVFTFGFVFTFNFLRNKQKSFEWRASISVFVCEVGTFYFSVVDLPSNPCRALNSKTSPREASFRHVSDNLR